MTFVEIDDTSIELPELRGTPGQIAYAARLRDDEIHQLRRWWIEAERFGDPGGEIPRSASWRGFARRHLYAAAAERWGRWLAGQSQERAEQPVAEEIFAKADEMEIEQIKLTVYARIAAVIQRDDARWWIEAAARETAYEQVLHVGDRDPLRRVRVVKKVLDT